MTIQYGWEKLHSAVNCLTGGGDVKDRLTLAVTHSLIQVRPENDLPESLQDRFLEFIDDMSSGVPEGEEGTVRAKVNGMSDWDVNLKTDEIVSMYDSICRWMGAEEGCDE